MAQYEKSSSRSQRSSYIGTPLLWILFLAFLAWQVNDIRLSVKQSLENRERIAERCETSVHQYLDKITPNIGGVISSTEDEKSTEMITPPIDPSQYP